jgi:Histidine kinase
VVYNKPAPSVSELVFIPLLFGICWLAGFAVRERAEQAQTAELRAAQAERERDAAARIAVAEERARIARELHDIVAHAVSVMVLQVGAVRHKLPDTLAEDRDALSSVEQATRRRRRCRGERRPWYQPRARAGRHPRTRQDLRRRDDRGTANEGGFVLSTRLPLSSDPI